MSNIRKTIIGIISTFALVALVATTAHAYPYTRDLTIGSSGQDVVALQTFLESRGYLVMPVGVSKGYFGPITQGAVAKFQAANAIQPTAGYFGPLTKARVAAIESVTVPPTSTVPGCTTGALFSSTTGAPCTGGSTVPGCFPGANFSTLTGAPCNGSSNNNNNNSTLNGNSGIIDDVTRLSQFNNEEVGEGEDDVQVLGFEVEASNDGDIALRSVRISFDPSGNTGSDHLDDYIEEVKIWQGDREIGSADVDDFSEDSDDTFSRTITLSNAIVREDDSERFYVTVTGANNFDSGDLPGSWTVNLDSVRYEDGSGVITTDSETGDLDSGFDVPIRFVSFSTAADTELRISSDSSSPDEGVVVIDDNGTTDDVVLLRGNIRVDGESDVTLDELPVTLTTSANTVADVTGTLKLTIDDEEYNESVNINSTTGVVTFDDLDLTLEAGEEYEFVISADINNIDDPDFAEGDWLTASITGTNRDNIDAENEEGDQLNDSTEKSGTAIGEEQIFQTEGIVAEFNSASTSVTSGSGSSDDLGTFRIRFTVSAVGDTVYIPADASDAVDFVVDRAGTPVASGLSATITNISDDDETGQGNYEIEEGDEETFELIVTVQLPTAGTAGQYRLTLTGINWDTADDSSPANTYTSNLGQFRTSYIGLN